MERNRAVPLQCSVNHPQAFYCWTELPEAGECVLLLMPMPSRSVEPNESSPKCLLNQ